MHVLLSLAGGSLDPESLTKVDLTGLATIAGDDAEPEYVAINGLDEVAVTLQENNEIVIVDGRTGQGGGSRPDPRPRIQQRLCCRQGRELRHRHGGHRLRHHRQRRRRGLLGGNLVLDRRNNPVIPRYFAGRYPQSRGRYNAGPFAFRPQGT
ncbi:hypothetical protein PRN20_11705 [Devosia sp. ZB163]|uniref:hypothetical protein n=1 Tax=Devosia sp. ZB163 TaxID=3025938 RepID=UPI002361D397|nr:hypothetical protein [Devosia sp. ZB163]MDC9824398.1 hypothetical protein [Devosia sp. ZB163]